MTFLIDALNAFNEWTDTEDAQNFFNGVEQIPRNVAEQTERSVEFRHWDFPRGLDKSV